jgi:hypothetical protein
MRYGKSLVSVFVVLLVFASGYLVAQGVKSTSAQEVAAAVKDGPSEENALLKKLVRAEFDKKTPEEVTQEFLAQNAAPHKVHIQTLRLAVSEEEVSEEVAFQSLRSYEAAADGAKSAAQVSQISADFSLRLQAYQVAQNARIIELLQKIADKK